MNSKINIWHDINEETIPKKISTRDTIKRSTLFIITCICFLIGYYMWIKHSSNTIALPVALGIFSFILTLHYHTIKKEKDVWVLFIIIITITGFFYTPILAILLFPVIRFMSSLHKHE